MRRCEEQQDPGDSDPHGGSKGKEEGGRVGGGDGNPTRRNQQGLCSSLPGDSNPHRGGKRRGGKGKGVALFPLGLLRSF